MLLFGAWCSAVPEKAQVSVAGQLSPVVFPQYHGNP